MSAHFVLKGNLCYSRDASAPEIIPHGYLVCEDGISKGAFPVLPDKYAHLPLTDYGDHIILPGLCDLHVHAPQYSFRALGMDLELLDWLNTHTFPEESKYHDLHYAQKAYSMFVNGLLHSPTTRACIFATVHTEATRLLMEQLEASGLVTMVGKVNMDRNCPDSLREPDAQHSFTDTRSWIEGCAGKYQNTSPILTPRFIPSCTDELMRRIKELQSAYGLPVQSHLSENQSEIAWVQELCPQSRSYGDAYAQFGLFGGKGVPTIMAHCVWSTAGEMALLRENGVYIAHCPQSNANLSSGIAPVRQYLNRGMRIGLGSDMAGGYSLSIFRAMSDAVQASKLYWRLVNQNDVPLTVWEAFYLGTVAGGSFFGKVGSFEEGYELDAVVIDDSDIPCPYDLTVKERVERIIYLSDDRHIRAKYVRGVRLALYSQRT